MGIGLTRIANPRQRGENRKIMTPIANRRQRGAHTLVEKEYMPGYILAIEMETESAGLE